MDAPAAPRPPQLERDLITMAATAGTLSSHLEELYEHVPALPVEARTKFIRELAQAGDFLRWAKSHLEAAHRLAAPAEPAEQEGQHSA